jgi:prepilin peptidase CpaA
MSPLTTTIIGFLVLLTLVIAYTDVRYRRIPNKVVFVTLLTGVVLNTVFGGLAGLLGSLGGFTLAFVLMLALHVFGAMGAGDVKLFGAVGSLIGASLVLPTFLIVALTGGVLALCKMIYARRVRTTMFGLVQFAYGLLPGGKVPSFDVVADRGNTIPYGVAVCVGSLISLFIFRA